VTTVPKGRGRGNLDREEFRGDKRRSRKSIGERKRVSKGTIHKKYVVRERENQKVPDDYGWRGTQ